MIPSTFSRAALIALAAVFATGASCARDAAPAAGAMRDADVLTIESSGKEYRFKVELARNDEERSQGLMFRTELAEDAGMLFDFGPAPRPVSMWMKNTLIPLDMAFIAEGGRIARIAAMTTPRSLTSIPSGEDVVAVLEVRGGRLAELGVREGDIIRHPWFAR
ncbi:MAG TPA: hypothetical protein DDZ68_12265 [Parvularcula sp.]|nr:hypothetical protein [Parvularcula sp.]HBS32041.1 hypothetical protein [Parvularcula sp.]HBS34397.1 hypothetical protein [Parvularcula sp.]